MKRIILAPENIKHRAILCLAYSAGLRISEIVALKMVDIDKDRMVITMRGAVILLLHTATSIYTHVSKKELSNIQSPLDKLL